jgi:hypothetical protein
MLKGCCSQSDRSGVVTLVFGQFSIETYKCEYAGLSIVASTARSQQTSRVGSPWTAQLRTIFFSHSQKGGARDWSRLEQCDTLVISANVNSSHWVVIVDYLREERFRVSPVTQEDSLLGATSGLSNLMPASLGCTTHSMLMATASGF